MPPPSAVQVSSTSSTNSNPTCYPTAHRAIDNSVHSSSSGANRNSHRNSQRNSISGTTIATSPSTTTTTAAHTSSSSSTTVTATTATTTSSSPTSPAAALSFADRIRAAEHRFTTLTQNIAHFSPLKNQLDKHNLAIERLENEIKKKAALLQACQDKIKSISKRPQTSSRQGSNVSLHTSEDGQMRVLLAQQQSAREVVESLNGQLLAAKILHIGLTRQVAQYFESRSELQALLEEIFSGSTPEHPVEDTMKRELEQITAEIQQVKDDFERHRSAKSEFKEIRRYVDIWNDTVEKQIASNPKDVTKSLKKFVPFFGPKPPSYTKIADTHMANARTFVPTIEDIGLLSDIKMDTIADTSSELVIYTARFKDAYNNLSHQLEVLHKKSRVLKKKKNQCIEKLFDERCRIFSEQLQAHYRSVGESLVGADADGLDSALIMGVVEDGTLTSNGSHQTILNNSGLRMALQRQHVEGNLLEPYSYSSEGSSTLGLDSQEILAESEELPSYFQHEYEASAHQHQQQQQQQQQQQHRHTHSRNHSQSHGNGHRRNFSLGSPAHSSSASSSLSLHSPLPIHATVLTTDSPPDYVREEPAATIATVSGHNHSTLASIAVQEDEADAQFQAYHSRYDSRQRQGSDPRTRPHITTMATIATANGGGSGNGSGAMDMPPEYEETRYHTAVNPA